MLQVSKNLILNIIFWVKKYLKLQQNYTKLHKTIAKLQQNYNKGLRFIADTYFIVIFKIDKVNVKINRIMIYYDDFLYIPLILSLDSHFTI